MSAKDMSIKEVIDLLKLARKGLRKALNETYADGTNDSIYYQGYIDGINFSLKKFAKVNPLKGVTISYEGSGGGAEDTPPPTEN